MLLMSMYKKACKYMFLDGWFQTQLKMMRGNSRPTTRSPLYVVSYGLNCGHRVLLVACPIYTMIFLHLLQVVVHQLNFIEKSLSSVALYDRDSDFLMEGK